MLPGNARGVRQTWICHHFFMQSTPHACLRFDDLRGHIVLRAGRDVSYDETLHQDMYLETG